jgi:hypothetical protein
MSDHGERVVVGAVILAVGILFFLALGSVLHLISGFVRDNPIWTFKVVSLTIGFASVSYIIGYVAMNPPEVIQR